MIKQYQFPYIFKNILGEVVFIKPGEELPSISRFRQNQEIKTSFNNINGQNYSQNDARSIGVKSNKKQLNQFKAQRLKTQFYLNRKSQQSENNQPINLIAAPYLRKNITSRNIFIPSKSQSKFSKLLSQRINQNEYNSEKEPEKNIKYQSNRKNKKTRMIRRQSEESNQKNRNQVNFKDSVLTNSDNSDEQSKQNLHQSGTNTSFKKVSRRLMKKDTKKSQKQLIRKTGRAKTKIVEIINKQKLNGGKQNKYNKKANLTSKQLLNQPINIQPSPKVRIRQNKYNKKANLTSKQLQNQPINIKQSPKVRIRQNKNSFKKSSLKKKQNLLETQKTLKSFKKVQLDQYHHNIDVHDNNSQISISIQSKTSNTYGSRHPEIENTFNSSNNIINFKIKVFDKSLLRSMRYFDNKQKSIRRHKSFRKYDEQELQETEMGTKIPNKKIRFNQQIMMLNPKVKNQQLKSSKKIERKKPFNELSQSKKNIFLNSYLKKKSMKEISDNESQSQYSQNELRISRNRFQNLKNPIKKDKHSRRMVKNTPFETDNVFNELNHFHKYLQSKDIQQDDFTNQNQVKKPIIINSYYDLRNSPFSNNWRGDFEKENKMIKLGLNVMKKMGRLGQKNI